ncbi:MAG: FAD-binding protein, partial [Myxococcota bacterium]
MSSDIERVATELARVLPAGAVSVAEADCLAVSTDLWPRHIIRRARGEQAELPMAVVWPRSTDEVQRIVHVARNIGIGLVAYGAGSSVVGGATPTARQVVIDFKRMA